MSKKAGNTVFVRELFGMMYGRRHPDYVGPPPSKADYTRLNLKKLRLKSRVVIQNGDLIEGLKHRFDGK